MRQLLHLMIVDRTRDLVLATFCSGRWLLPMIAGPETSRIGPLVVRWLEERGIDGQPIGQWLGRACSRQGMLDWLVPIDVGDDAQVSMSSSLRWTVFETLRGAPSLLEYQEWAVRSALAGHTAPSVPGPFGTPTWLQEVQDWIRRSLEHLGTAADSKAVAHRLSAYEVVLEWRTAKGRWFFKGLAPDRAAEATVTSAFAQLEPASFATTVVLEQRPDGSTWWLMEACPGKPLAVQLSSDLVARVGRAYAKVQQTIALETASGRGVFMPVIDKQALAAWVESILDEGGAEAMSPASLAAVETACTEVCSTHPLSWVAADLDPTNIVVDGREVRFIDLDDALLGPAPLGIATLVRRIGRAALNDAQRLICQRCLIDAYERAWSPRLELSQTYRALELVSQLVECRLAWWRVEAKIARNEVHGVEEMARAAIRRSLSNAIDGYQRSPRHW